MNRSERRAELALTDITGRTVRRPTEDSLRAVARWQTKRVAQIKRLMPKPTFEQKLGALVTKFAHN